MPPLAGARRHLSRAKRNHQDEYYTATRADLHQASNYDSATINSEIRTADHYLEESLGSAGPVMAEQIKRLRNELKVLTGEFASDRAKAKRHCEQIMADRLHLVFKD